MRPVSPEAAPRRPVTRRWTYARPSQATRGIPALGLRTVSRAPEEVRGCRRHLNLLLDVGHSWRQSSREGHRRC